MLAASRQPLTCPLNPRPSVCPSACTGFRHVLCTTHGSAPLMRVPCPAPPTCRHQRGPVPARQPGLAEPCHQLGQVQRHRQPGPHPQGPAAAGQDADGAVPATRSRSRCAHHVLELQCRCIAMFGHHALVSLHCCWGRAQVRHQRTACCMCWWLAQHHLQPQHSFQLPWLTRGCTAAAQRTGWPSWHELA